MIFGLSEALLALIIILILLAPWKIPQLAKAIRESMAEFKKASSAKSKAEARATVSKLRKVAKELGVEIKGKNATQLLKDIEKALKKSR
jgi:Sec-independent protein translocase protein TatA